jgi:hypothetical protein
MRMYVPIYKVEPTSGQTNISYKVESIQMPYVLCVFSNGQSNHSLNCIGNSLFFEKVLWNYEDIIGDLINLRYKRKYIKTTIIISQSKLSDVTIIIDFFYFNFTILYISY